MNDTQKPLLLVDDNLDNIELLEEILKAQGYRTLIALTGHDAIRLAANEQPDLILLDIAMPVMDGMEVLHVLKSDSNTAKIPVIFVTGVPVPPPVFLKACVQLNLLCVKPLTTNSATPGL